MQKYYPTVSVIVPVYNVEKYLNRCIQSIVNQSYKKLEIILIDDGSPDSSGQIAESWSKKDSRIKVIHQKNGGLSVARNTGINVCCGDWIVFIDSDDYVATNYIEKMLRTALHDKTKLVISNYSKLDDLSKKITSSRNNAQPGIYNIKSFWQEYCHDFKSKSFDYAFWIVAWNKLYNKDIFKNIRYKKGILNEDEEIIYNVVKAAGKISIISDYLYFYCVNRSGSIMKQESIKGELRPQFYEIFIQRIMDMMSDGLYNAAGVCTETLILSLINDSSKLPIKKDSKDIITTNNVLKEVKSISSDLKLYKVKLSFKANLCVHFPFISCIYKKIINNLTL